jgi:hypothetical protein
MTVTVCAYHKKHGHPRATDPIDELIDLSDDRIDVEPDPWDTPECECGEASCMGACGYGTRLVLS